MSEAMTDSVFIACYLDDVGQGPPLRPADPYGRWEMMTWCRQMIERTAPAAAYLGCRAHPPEADADARCRASAAWICARAGNRSPPESSPRRQLADSRTKIRQAVDKIEARLDGPAVAAWASSRSPTSKASRGWPAWSTLVPAAFAGRPRTSAWLERVRSHPAVAKALSLARSADPAASWSVGPEINRWG